MSLKFFFPLYQKPVCDTNLSLKKKPVLGLTYPLGFLPLVKINGGPENENNN